VKRRWTQLIGVGVAGLVVAGWLVSCNNGGSNTNSSGSTNTQDTATPPEVADSVIVLAVNQGPKPRHQRLDLPSGMSVAWQNTDDRGHTIRFTDWPFREPHTEIAIAAGATSAVFHLYPGQPAGKYKYGIFPPVKGDPGMTQIVNTGPPDPPDIEAGP
jgi:hypothetical protein